METGPQHIPLELHGFNTSILSCPIAHTTQPIPHHNLGDQYLERAIADFLDPRRRLSSVYLTFKTAIYAPMLASKCIEDYVHDLVPASLPRFIDDNNVRSTGAAATIRIRESWMITGYYSDI